MKSAVAFLATAKSDESKRFYQDVVGLTWVEETRFLLMFDAFGTRLRIQKVGAVQAAPYTAFGIDVDDIVAEVTRLESKGVRGERYEHFQQDAQGIWEAPSGTRVFWFRDPDGNLISLSQSA